MMPCFSSYGAGDFRGLPVNEVLSGTPAIVCEYSTRPNWFQLISTTAVMGGDEPAAAVTRHLIVQSRQLAVVFLPRPGRWLPSFRPDQGCYDLSGSQHAWYTCSRMCTGAGKVEVFKVFGAIVGSEPR